MSKERKTILIIGAILLVLGAAYRWLPDLKRFYSLEDDIEAKAKKLAAYEQIIREKDQLEAEFSAITQALQQSEMRLLGGETPALAAAEMQSILSKIANESQIQIPTMRIMNPSDSDREIYSPVSIQLMMMSSIEQLKDILYKIENFEKLFVIKNLRVRSVGGQGNNSIEATMTVEGYMKTKKGSSNVKNPSVGN